MVVLTGGEGAARPAMKSTGGSMESTREKSYLIGDMSRLIRLVIGVGSCCRRGRSLESSLRRASRSDSSMASGKRLAML